MTGNSLQSILLKKAEAFGRACRTVRGMVFITVSLLMWLVCYHYLEVIGFLTPHLRTIVEMGHHHAFSVSPLFHLYSVWLHDFSFRYFTYKEAGNIVITAHTLLCFYVLCHVLQRLNEKTIDYPLLILLAISLMIVSPIGVPNVPLQVYSMTDDNRTMLLLRNPTHAVAQPYIILAFGYCCLIMREFFRTDSYRMRHAWIMGVALVMATLAKPNFALSFLPTLALFGLWYCRRYPRLFVVLVMVTVPVAMVIAWQSYYLLVNGSIGRVRSVYYAPLVVWRHNNRMPFLAFSLTVIYPVFLTLVRLRKLHFYTALAWCNFIIASLPYTLLRETGDRDFEWGFWYGLQLLFLACVLELLAWFREAKDPPPKQAILLFIACMLLGLHVGFGVLRFAKYYPYYQ